MARREFLVTLLLTGFLGLASYQADGQPPSPSLRASDMTEEHWINSPPLTGENLRSHVVLLEFWTYG